MLSSSMACRISLRSTHSLRVVLLLAIFIFPYYIWKQHTLLQRFDIPLQAILPNAKTAQNNSVLWARFLNLLAIAHPDGTTLKVDRVKEKFPEIQLLDDAAQRLDAAHLSEKSLERSRAAHAFVVALIPDYSDVVQYHRRSRGIVYVGGGRFMGPVMVSVRMLRRKNSVLPVEVFLPSEEDYDPYVCEEVLKELNARCIVLPKLESFSVKKYQYKALAMLLSSFENILFLDADNIPLIDPSELFDSAPYTVTGLVTWPDFWASSSSPLYYKISAQAAPPLTQHATTEAGQTLISKRKHAMTLLLATYYNLYGPKFYYRLLSQGAPGEGDKDTILAAATALNASYYQVRERVMPIGYHDSSGHYTGAAMCQRHPGEDYALHLAAPDEGYRSSGEPRIIFIHHSGIKLNPRDLLGHLDTGYRMWGPKGQTVERFGFDLEAQLWEEILAVACKGRRDQKRGPKVKRACDGLRRFWDDILEKEKRNEDGGEGFT